MIIKDDEIADAIDQAGVLAKMKYGTNRYAQTMPELTFVVTTSKRGTTSWSNY